MATMKRPGEDNVPIVDRDARPAVALRVVVLAAVLAASAGAFIVFKNQLDNELVLGVLGVLAMAGIFFVVSALIGFIEIMPQAAGSDDLARSFLEGVAFSYLFVKQKLDPERRIREFRLGGGGTSNLQWMQIMADTLNLPIRLSNDPEAGIVGAANLARYGRSADLLESSRRVMQGARVVEPIAENVAIYEELAGRYFAVRQSLRTPLLARQGLRPLKALKTRPVRKEISLVRKTNKEKKPSLN